MMNYLHFAIYDDLIANFFLDKLFLWFPTTRVNVNYNMPDTDRKSGISILREYLVYGRTNVSGAVEAFLRLPYFNNFLQEKEQKEKGKFARHLKKYVSMFVPGAGFEVSSTKRYTGQMEACIIANKHWQAGEYIKNCTGSVCCLTSEADQLLRSEGKDFSVMLSQRYKHAFLFLGPARFMNHDCNPNCAFVKHGNEVTFRAVRAIKPGEELTVKYGDHYFGINNSECRCATCEKNEKGYYSKKQSVESSQETTGLRRSSRKRKEVSHSDCYVPKKVKKQKRIATPDLSQGESDSAESTASQETVMYATIKKIMSICNICNQDDTSPCTYPEENKSVDNSINLNSPSNFIPQTLSNLWTALATEEA
ncbi:hypothetical protein G6F70_003959 [Rhizopus microsporus]|nr:hypothetical protein G6F71_003997 [Rhizopus microsporus]KAG1200552.1 hypothetical protein G6F70_003959 [Rhizopus microsporus]KAG1212925.1 hypothetical protein G6F69_003274 [Rhizopus microsporus]KAG1234289.1 hypothetical protein G6F67_003636 [Rhizopus microsporus]KAG1266542.1 hypothetical protein G6F68_002667 [Rhizopus microsporus]